MTLLTNLLILKMTHFDTGDYALDIFLDNRDDTLDISQDTTDDNLKHL